MPNRTTLKLLDYKVVDREKLKAEQGTAAAIEAPEAPAWLPLDAAEVWREVSAVLIAYGLWAPAFAVTLAAFCVLDARFRRDPDAFPVTAMVQRRLLAADLGLNPSTLERARHAAAKARK